MENYIIPEKFQLVTVTIAERKIKARVIDVPKMHPLFIDEVNEEMVTVEFLHATEVNINVPGWLCVIFNN